MILDMAVRRVMGTASWVRAIGDEKGGYLVRYYQRFGDKEGRMYQQAKRRREGEHVVLAMI